MSDTRPPFHRLTEDTSFFFVRHGESTGNANRVIQGRFEYPLSKTGREQARYSAGFFAQEPPDLMLTSPLRRAAETADIIAESCGYPGKPETVEEMQELDTGIFSTYTFDDLPTTFPEEWKRFRKDSWEAVPEAESIESLYSRALAVWSHLIDAAETGHRRIVSVTHGGVLQWIFRASFGSTSSGWLPFVKASNGGIFHFAVHPIYLPPGRRLRDAFFSEWRLVNHRPGLDAPVEEYSSHLGPKR